MIAATDSARWCDTCQRWGDHHTDRHLDALFCAWCDKAILGTHVAVGGYLWHEACKAEADKQ